MVAKTDSALKTQITTNTRNRTTSNKIVLAEQADIQEDIVDSKANKSITTQLRTDVDAKATQTDLVAVRNRVTQNETDIQSNTTAINAIDVPSDTDDLTEGSTNLYLTLANLYSLANALTSIQTVQVADKLIVLDESETGIATFSMASLRNQIGVPDPTGQSDGMVLKTLNGLWTIGTDSTSSGGSGLDQTAVDGRINTLRPVVGRYIAASDSGVLTANDIAYHAAVIIVNVSGSTNKTITLPLIRAQDRLKKVKIIRVADDNDTSNLVIRQNTSETGSKIRNLEDTEVNSITFGGSRLNNVSGIELQILDDNGIDNWFVTGQFNTIDTDLLLPDYSTAVNGNGLFIVNGQPTWTTPSQMQFDAPAISSFAIDGFVPPIPAGMAFNGQQTLRYTVLHPSNVSGNLSLSIQRGNGAAQVIATNINPNNTSQQITISGQAATVAGTRYRLRLFGDDTQGSTFENIFEFTVAQAHEMAYFDVSSSNTLPTWSSVSLPTGQQAIDVQDSIYSFQTLTTAHPTGLEAASGRYFWIMVPRDREPNDINDGFGNTLPDEWTQVRDARTIGSTNMTVYYRQNNSRYTLRYLFTVRKTS